MNSYTLAAAIACLLISNCTVATDVDFKTMTINEVDLDYAVAVPDNFDASKEYPILVALPPGAQNRKMVQAGFNLYWNAAKSKGWIVVSPVAPKGKFFNQGAEDLIPGFFERDPKGLQSRRWQISSCRN